MAGPLYEHVCAQTLRMCMYMIEEYMCSQPSCKHVDVHLYECTLPSFGHVTPVKTGVSVPCSTL